LNKWLDVQIWGIPNADVCCKGPVTVQGPVTGWLWYLVLLLVRENPPEPVRTKGDLRGCEFQKMNNYKYVYAKPWKVVYLFGTIESSGTACLGDNLRILPK